MPAPVFVRLSRPGSSSNPNRVHESHERTPDMADSFRFLSSAPAKSATPKEIDAALRRCLPGVAVWGRTAIIALADHRELIRGAVDALDRLAVDVADGRALEAQYVRSLCRRIQELVHAVETAERWGRRAGGMPDEDVPG